MHNWYGGEWLEYEMEVPVTGAWKVGLWARNAGGTFPPPPYQFLVDVHVNGAYVGRIAVPLDRTVYQHAFLTANLSAARTSSATPGSTTNTEGSSTTPTSKSGR